MVSFPKSVGNSGVNAKGILVTGLVLLLVLALFFIPELVNFQRSLSRSPQGTVSSSSQVKRAQDDLAALRASEGYSPETRSILGAETDSGTALDEVSAMLNPSYIEQTRAKSAVERLPGGSARQAEGGSLPKLTWDSLRSGASEDAIQKAENEAAIIAKQLPDRYPASRFALLNFASSLRVIRTGGEKVMQPVDAVRYVDYTRLGVVHAMEREGVDREYYNRFATMSLGPVLDAQRGIGIADVPKVFSPNLVLTRVSVYRQPSRSRRGVDESTAKVLVSFAGYVVGRDVKQIEVYQNGIRLDRLLAGRADPEGRRYFRYARRNQKDGRGVFTLRITDTYGQVVERRYLFYPRARQFDWQRGGYYNIPKLQPGDRRIDRFFSYGRDALVMSPGMAAFDGGPEMETF